MVSDVRNKPGRLQPQKMARDLKFLFLWSRWIVSSMMWKQSRWSAAQLIRHRFHIWKIGGFLMTWLIWKSTHLRWNKKAKTKKKTKKKQKQKKTRDFSLAAHHLRDTQGNGCLSWTIVYKSVAQLQFFGILFNKITRHAKKTHKTTDIYHFYNYLCAMYPEDRVSRDYLLINVLLIICFYCIKSKIRYGTTWKQANQWPEFRQL